MLGIGLPTLIAEVLSFLLFLYILSRLPFGFPMITKVLEERRLRIQAQLDAAAKDRQEAADLKASLEAEIQKTREETRRMLDEAERTAREEGRELVEEARRQAETLVKSAREEIQAEKEAVLREVYGQVVDLTLAVTRKVLGKELDDPTHRRLIEESIGRVERPQ